MAHSDGGPRGVLELARAYVAMLHSLGNVQVLPQKTRLVCVARVRFAGLSPRKRGFQASFALHRWLDSPRIVKQVDYGPRWRGHYVKVQARRLSRAQLPPGRLELLELLSVAAQEGVGGGT